MSYHRQFHCLLCSSLYIALDEYDDVVPDPEDAENRLFEIDQEAIHLHYCEDGGIGVAVIAGYRKVVVHDIY